MKVQKKWYTYNRNGIIYVQFKDKITHKRLTAISTRTRNAKEAEQIIYELYYHPESDFNKSQWEQHKAMFAPMIQTSVEAALAEALKNMAVTAGESPMQNANGITAAAHPAEIRPLIEQLNTLTFYEYLLLFWDYDKSPYIKQLARLGKKIPNPERFMRNVGILKYHQKFFNDTKLTEIAADEINTILGLIKNHHTLADSTMCNFRYIFTQALDFAYKNNLILHNMCYGITKFSNKNKEKQVFTKEEMQKIFNSQINPFKRPDYFLINKLLFVSGCRIGEILALQQNDIIHTTNGYVLNISKSYTDTGKRLKATKTERSDYVHISDEMAAELFDFIKTSPFNSEKAFVFYSKQKERPIHYDSVQRNFQRAMKRLGIKRNGLTLHSYRHTYAVFLAQEGYSQAELKYMTRHDSLKELQRYMSHITPELELKNIEAAHIFQKMIA